VNAGAVAIPLLFVEAVAVVNPPLNVPLAPLAGAVKVTVTPLSRLLLASLTVAVIAVPKAAATAAVCEIPPPAVMLAGAAVVFVRLKLAGADTPDTVAVTV
jgi:hypothetical protein